MRRLGKLGAVALCLCLLAALAGCGGRGAEPEEAETLHIYATFYPIYAIAGAVIEGAPDLELHQLVQPQDGCLRSYVLSDWDAALLGSADAVFAGGSGLESFDSVLPALGEDRFAVTQLIYNMELMEVEAANADPDAESHWLGENPHVYMSVDGGIEIAGRVAQSMVLLDPRYEELYLDNLERVEARFEALRGEIAGETAELAGVKAGVLNEALVYAARDYGLDVVLYWDRESGESMGEGELEALLAELKARDVRLVLIERQAPKELVDALEAEGFAVARLDVLSTHPASDGVDGYFEALRSNAATVRAAWEGASKEGA